MSLLALYLLFAKIGVFTFGGGYAMIPFFQDELVSRHALMTSAEFADIVALAQMTPGPVGLNAATYIGQQQAGLPGALAATLGVATPSLILGLLVAIFLRSYEKSRHWQGVLCGIRPATLGLIAASVIFFAETSLFTAPVAALWRAGESFGLCWQGVAIFLGAYLVQWKWKPNLLWVLLGAAVAGWLLFLPGRLL
ncbi:MAG: chromate transporter [Oligosphaeraceae bacterium]